MIDALSKGETTNQFRSPVQGLLQNTLIPIKILQWSVNTIYSSPPFFHYIKIKMCPTQLLTVYNIPCNSKNTKLSLLSPPLDVDV